MTPEQESDFIGIKNSIYPLQDGLIKLGNRVEKLESNRSLLNVDDLDKRIKILEEARQRQIALNSTFAPKVDKPRFRFFKTWL